MTTPRPASASDRQFREVAPFIAEAVGDVSRPRAGLAFAAKLDHLPGDGGLLAGARTVSGLMRRGAAHIQAEHLKHGPIYRTMFWNLPVVCVCDPELLAQITKNEDQAWSSALAWRVFFEGIDPTSDTLDAPVMLDFEPHRDVRKALQPAFSGAATAAYIDIATPMFVQRIEQWTHQGEVKFASEIRRLLAETSARIFMGIDDPNEGAMPERSLAAFWAGPTAMAHNPWLSGTWRSAMRGHRTLREAFRVRVAERRANPGPDLFSRLCVAASAESWLDDDTIVRLFIGIMAAAFDTTSLGLSSMAYLLARHPEWQERLRVEVGAFDRFSCDDARRYEQTDWAWKETLRLFPVASNVPRRALRDVQLGGYDIPAGTLVLAMIAPVLRDPTWWTEPESFDPERFSESRAEDRKNKGVFLPFGSGAHACIGMHLANMEVKAFWHAMLTRCRFTLKRDRARGHALRPLGTVNDDVQLVIEPLA